MNSERNANFLQNSPGPLAGAVEYATCISVEE